MSTTTYTQAELQAKKVPELKAILGNMGLAQAGVKADLVSRIITEQQNQGGITGKTDLGAASNALGDIPSEDALPSVTGDGDAPPAVAATSGNDAQAATDSTAQEAATTSVNGETVTAADGDPATQEAADAFAASLPAVEGTTKETESQKRAKRLARFGGNAEEIAKLDRAERFGSSVVDDSSVFKLDSELSNKRLRKNDGGAAKPTNSNNARGKPQQQSNTNKPPAAAALNKKPTSKPAAAVAAKPALSAEEEEKRKKRAERFAGGAAAAAAASSS